jgi:hypothetical protein
VARPERQPFPPVKVARKVRSVLQHVGFTDAELEKLCTVGQSQQTVDRDYKAS